MNTEPAISVVVSTHDRPARLKRLLRALRGQSLDRNRFEVVVVDNGSAPETKSLLDAELRREGLQLNVITPPQASSPAAARNLGWRAARSETIAFTDDDCEPAPDWLAVALGVASGEPAAVIQGRTVPNPAELDRLGPFARTMSIERGGPYYQTCNIVYPRVLLERLGGFDEGFSVLGGEDTDLAWRAFDSGASAVFARDAVVHHAVENLGPRRHLQVAMRWADAMAVFRRPALRREALYLGVFWKRSHARLAAALLGAALSQRFLPALVLTLPYARNLRSRCARFGASPAIAPYFVLHDLLETYTAVRGGLRHRVLVL